MKTNLRITSLMIGLICAAATAPQISLRAQNSKANVPFQKRLDSPVHVLDFQLNALVAGVQASPVLSIPFACGSSGTVLVNMINVTDRVSDGSSTLYAIRGDKATRIDVVSASDIDIESVDSFFPSETGEVLFLDGRFKNGSVTRKEPRKHFVAFFGSKGEYQRSIEIQTQRIAGGGAILPSGDLLVSGLDLNSRLSTLEIYSASGELIRPLDQPRSAVERDATGPPSTVGIGLINRGSHVLAYRAGTRDAILEIGEKDTVREVPLLLPPGAVISDMVASDDTFIVHSFPDMIPGKAVDSASGTYYEFDPLDGSLIRILKSGSPLVSNIACKANGQYTAFVTNKDHQFMRMTAPE